jgi:hypothetical protein
MVAIIVGFKPEFNARVNFTICPENKERLPAGES